MLEFTYLKGVNSGALIAENKQLKEYIVILQDQLAQLNRMIFGRKSERFVYQENQLGLFGNDEEEVNEVLQTGQTTIAAHTRKINSTLRHFKNWK